MASAMAENIFLLIALPATSRAFARSVQEAIRATAVVSRSIPPARCNRLVNGELELTRMVATWYNYACRRVEFSLRCRLEIIFGEFRDRKGLLMMNV